MRFSTDSLRRACSSSSTVRLLCCSLSTAFGVIAAMWLLFYVVGRPTISMMYEGTSPIRFLNQMITSQTTNDVEHFYRKAERTLIQFTLLIAVCAPIPVARSFFLRTHLGHSLYRWSRQRKTASVILGTLPLLIPCWLLWIATATSLRYQRISSFPKLLSWTRR